MPSVKVVFYQEKEGHCFVLDWLSRQQTRVEAKARVRIERLAEVGHEMRRPDSDYLRDGIYELRWRRQSVNYRILYFFHGRDMVVLSHGITKESKVPAKEIERAVQHKKAFEKDPKSHTYVEESK